MQMLLEGKVINTAVKIGLILSLYFAGLIASSWQLTPWLRVSHPALFMGITECYYFAALAAALCAVHAKDNSTRQIIKMYLVTAGILALIFMFDGLLLDNLILGAFGLFKVYLFAPTDIPGFIFRDIKI